MARLWPYFPKSHAKPPVAVRREPSGSTFINRSGLGWSAARTECGPPKAAYDLWKRWSASGVFAHIQECNLLHHKRCTSVPHRAVGMGGLRLNPRADDIADEAVHRRRDPRAVPRIPPAAPPWSRPPGSPRSARRPSARPPNAARHPQRRSRERARGREGDGEGSAWATESPEIDPQAIGNVWELSFLARASSPAVCS